MALPLATTCCDPFFALPCMAAYRITQCLHAQGVGARAVIATFPSLFRPRDFECAPSLRPFPATQAPTKMHTSNQLRLDECQPEKGKSKAYTVHNNKPRPHPPKDRVTAGPLTFCQHDFWGTASESTTTRHICVWYAAYGTHARSTYALHLARHALDAFSERCDMGLARKHQRDSKQNRQQAEGRARRVNP